MRSEKEIQWQQSTEVVVGNYACWESEKVSQLPAMVKLENSCSLNSSNQFG